jgi:hypothetical protein
MRPSESGFAISLIVSHRQMWPPAESGARQTLPRASAVAVTWADASHTSEGTLATQTHLLSKYEYKTPYKALTNGRTP